MKTENSTRSSLDWTALWLALLLAVTGIIALSATSCKSPAPTVTASRHLSDSLQNVKQSVLTLLPVAASEVRMTLPMNRLDALPQGAGYNGRSGQAVLSVRRISEDSIAVTATCDSLARQVMVLTEQLTRIRSETSREVEELPPKVVREPTGWQWFQIWTGRIAVLGLVLIVVKRRLNNKLKTKS